MAALVDEDRADEVIEVYAAENPGASPSELYFLVHSDHRYVMASITIAERRAALTPDHTYLYYLTWETELSGRGMGSPHTLDIPFIFDNVRTHPFTRGQDRAVAAGRSNQRYRDRVRPHGRPQRRRAPAVARL